MSDNLSPLWTAQEFASAVASSVNAEWNATGLSIDTRSLQAGDVFIALTGENTDGHDYVQAAFDKGAVAALVQDDFVAPATFPATLENNLVRVPDVSISLYALATAARKRCKAQVLAVTGSVGKTSVKESLRLGLLPSGKTHASVKSFNNHIGVPLSLARLPRDYDYAIFEIGMSHAGEITPLSQLVRPHIAIITQIAEAHSENFASLGDIARAKAEIIAGLEANGTLIIPAHAPHVDILERAAQAANVAHLVKFSTDTPSSPAAALCDTHLTKMVLHETCSCIAAIINGQALTCKIGQVGAHHVSNALATLTAIDLCGGDLALASLALSQSFLDGEGIAGRGQRHILRAGDGGDYTLIDESYNANPASMWAALSSLGLMPRLRGGRRIAVLGDMAELGTQSPALHKALSMIVEEADIDMVMSCGVLMHHLHQNLPPDRVGVHKDNAMALLPHLQSEIHSDDVVMVKGSRSANMDMIVETLSASVAATTQEGRA
ncbi:MAG: UDP-N-acetylmuramoyl-tripeptide--D-alanyl-D-alanine ligase [Alphaproteobacteria bacterium]|nr:UDP-N-acetylmuramoyl-tripeptide--D-alanyl-D-alanine ligase [Alphaproteobacteria bacterium]